MHILGIETSCDETSIAVLEDSRILANRTYTQEVHRQYGGVVPEAASRAHLDKIEPLCRSVFATTGLSPGDIDLIAVTDRPGLAGALLVGVSFALGMHAARATAITGINHLEGHIYSIFLDHPLLRYPFLAAVVSGGHTAIYKVEAIDSYVSCGQTVDDAAGEAFDKVGKMLGFAYPAGQAIEQEAARCTDSAGIRFPVARLSTAQLDFSFSGLKTAVRYFLLDKDEHFKKENRAAICRAFQTAAIASLTNAITAAAHQMGINRIAVVGGVACNGALRKKLKEELDAEVWFPSPGLCTDNAAMIARAGYERALHSRLRFPCMDPSAEL